MRLPLPSADTAPGRLELEDRLVETISRRLALQVGPMAPVYLRQALRDAQTPTMLCALLSKGIEDPLQRDRFVRDAEALLVPVYTAAAAAPADPLPSVAGPASPEAAADSTVTGPVQAMDPWAHPQPGSGPDDFDPTATSRIPVEPRVIPPAATVEAVVPVPAAAPAVAPPPPAPMPVIPQTPPAPPVLTDGEIEQTLQALVQVIGPIARSVVRRAVVRARDRQALQILCEASVPRDGERERFRALLRAPSGVPRGR